MRRLAEKGTVPTVLGADAVRGAGWIRGVCTATGPGGAGWIRGVCTATRPESEALGTRDAWPVLNGVGATDDDSSEFAFAMQLVWAAV